LDLSLLVFAAVYGVMLFGRVPGLHLDRTGAALLGGIVLVVGGTLDLAAAWRAIDVGTLALLFGLMLVSAQFRRSGSYAWVVRQLAARPTSPERLLGELVAVTGVSAALLTNDVVCLAAAPVLIEVCNRRQLDPVPFLLGLAAAANVGSAATLLGNPQNMLIGQALDLSFARYLTDGAVPAALGLVIVWWVLARAYRSDFARSEPLPAVGAEPLDPGAAGKGIVVLLLLVLGLLFAPVPHEVQALAAGGAMLLSRRQRSRDLLELVDWHLLVLFAGLFVVNHAFQQAGHAAQAFGWLRQHGLDLGDPRALFATGVIGSNLVSNVPLTMLLLPVAAHPMAGPILALSTTMAGNLLLIGSIANLIVVEQARRLGVAPRGRSWASEHWRTGVPITLATLTVAAGWLWLRRQVLA
jgi:Na+/H+ antiporter NhaD/arsenite permease-like protein